MNDKTQSKAVILNNLTSLHVTGNDSTKFLHAQFTNDLANLSVNGWQYSAYCTPKGRLLAFMNIARLDENEYLLILPAEVSEKILPRLRMFVMRDDVTITPQDEGTSILGFLHANEDIAGTKIKPENKNGKLVRENNNYLLTLDHESDRYLYIGEAEKLEVPVSTDSNDWALADIRSGVPTVVVATQEAWVPQMVNLDLIGAVNFKKGCYPGQEIVARVHYLGKIKQRMYVLETTSQQPAQPGDKIFTAGQQDKAAGTVVQSAMEDTRQIIQAVLQTKTVDENQDLRLSSADGEELTLSTQPYSLTLDEE